MKAQRLCSAAGKTQCACACIKGGVVCCGYVSVKGAYLTTIAPLLAQVFRLVPSCH
ncbi:MAG: hypothetical protein JST71_12245 [Bacteroidetes bacterium]|nr:hypothetical protein [Bacteroidota bacterium]